MLAQIFDAVNHVPNQAVAHFAVGQRHIDIDGPQRLERELQVPDAVAEGNSFGEHLERFAGRLRFGGPIELFAGRLNFDHVVRRDGVLRIGIGGDGGFDAGAEFAVTLRRVGGEATMNVHRKHSEQTDKYQRHPHPDPLP